MAANFSVKIVDSTTERTDNCVSFVKIIILAIKGHMTIFLKDTALGDLKISIEMRKDTWIPFLQIIR